MWYTCYELILISKGIVCAGRTFTVIAGRVRGLLLAPSPAAPGAARRCLRARAAARGLVARHLCVVEKKEGGRRGHVVKGRGRKRLTSMPSLNLRQPQPDSGGRRRRGGERGARGAPTSAHTARHHMARQPHPTNKVNVMEMATCNLLPRALRLSRRARALPAAEASSHYLSLLTGGARAFKARRARCRIAGVCGRPSHNELKRPRPSFYPSGRPTPSLRPFQGAYKRRSEVKARVRLYRASAHAPPAPTFTFVLEVGTLPPPLRSPPAS